MTDDKEAGNDSTQRDNGAGKVSTLTSAQSYVAASPGASGQGDGGREAFATSFKVLLEWGEAACLIFPIEKFDFFSRIPEGHGDEHEAWFDEANNCWFKATYPNQFGLAWGRDGSATACEYLTRLTLQNKYFADAIDLVGLINDHGKLRILTRQPHVVGDPAIAEEIRFWFETLGFKRFEAGGSVAWYRHAENLLVADAHEGNIIRNSSGLFAIDLNLIQPQGEMLNSVLGLLPP